MRFIGNQRILWSRVKFFRSVGSLRWVRHFLLFKRYVCEECSNELMAKGKKPQKLKKL